MIAGKHPQSAGYRVDIDRLRLVSDSAEPNRRKP